MTRDYMLDSERDMQFAGAQKSTREHEAA